jgi:xylan 1,4-beta-xylosidase
MIRALFVLAILFALASTAIADDLLPVSIDIDAGHALGPWNSAWRFFGYDEADYTFMPRGQQLLTELSQLQGPQIFIRCHHLLTSGDGRPALKWSSTNAFTEDADGNPVYDWTVLDKIFDTYVHRGLKPYAQIGFMPKALSSRPDLYPNNPDPSTRVPVDAGQAYPPTDYNKWRDLVQAWVSHCVQRYGKAEVESWYWEVWNEPNINYWKGTPEEYFKLYDFAVDGVRRALPDAKVGGPEQAGGGGRFLRNFLQHCIDGPNAATGKTGSPIDFISFHAKGSPRFVDGHVQMGLRNQLGNIESGFATVAQFPQFKNTPIVIGESDPDGCAACTGPQLGYRNTPLYAAYTAEALSRSFEIADKHQINFAGALTWAFEFENDSPFAGHRVLSSAGIDLPILNLFRMLAKMNGTRLAVQSSAAQPLEPIEKTGVRTDADVNALAALSGDQLAILVWNYADDDIPASDADITVAVNRLPHDGRAFLGQYRIDETHSNPYALWLKMGSPANPTADEFSELQSIGGLSSLGMPLAQNIQDGQFQTKIRLPRQGISLLILHLQ